MKTLVAVAAALILSTGLASAGPQSLEVRFCPASQVRTYPLDSRRDVKGLVLQNVAIVNHGTQDVALDEVSLNLLRGDETIDSRRLTAGDLEQIARRDAKLQASGMLAAVPFQFCGQALIERSVALGGRVLAPGHALLIMQQVFAYSGVRDRVRVDVAGSGVRVSAILPVSDGFARTAFRFPLRGTWFIGNGPTFHTDHRWALPEEFAFDIVKIDAGGVTHRGDGTKFSDFYDYGADVLAAADGRVVAAETGQPEDATVLQRPDETQDAYFARLQQHQASLLAKGTAAVAGNYVLIDHGDGEYSLYAHLKPGSVRVHPGESVKAGDVIGRLGSSGNSTEPHLHFQVCDRPDPLMCAGIPVNFTNATVLWADSARPIQSGDVVTAN